MKLLYPLLCYYPSVVGGPANTIYWLNKTLGKNGFYSFVVSTRYGLKKDFIRFKPSYEKFNIDAEFISGSVFSFLSKEQIKKLKAADIIHFSSLFFKPTLFYLFLGLLWSKKIVISPRGELYPSAIKRKKWGKQFYIKVLSLFQKKINFHSTNSVETGYIEKYFPYAKSINKIPNYIELPEKLTCDTKNQILFLGRINPIKNIDILIKVFAELPDSLISKFSLVIAGEAILNYEKDYKQQLEKLINELELASKVQFIGGAYGRKKEKLLAESYCLVLPSKSENFGNVVLEALCQGTPTIVTKNAPWEIIEEYKAGYWIDPEVEDILQVLQIILSFSSDEYQTLRDNALNLALSEFDIEKNIDKWINFYNNI